MFQPNEREVVESIIEDRSINVMLQEEQRQARTQRLTCGGRIKPPRPGT